MREKVGVTVLVDLEIEIALVLLGVKIIYVKSKLSVLEIMVGNARSMFRKC